MWGSHTRTTAAAALPAHRRWPPSRPVPPCAAKLPGAPVLVTALDAPGSAEMTTDQVSPKLPVRDQGLE